MALVRKIYDTILIITNIEYQNRVHYAPAMDRDYGEQKSEGNRLTNDEHDSPIVRDFSEGIDTQTRGRD